MGFLQSAYVIGRRDFVATVWSRTFLFFLIGPLFILGISLLFGASSSKMARQDLRSSVAIVAPLGEFTEINRARSALNPAFGENGLPELLHAEPDYSIDPQVKDLLAATDKRILAVLTGGVERPKLTGDIRQDGSVRRQMQLILDEVRSRRALEREGVSLPPTKIQVVKVAESAGSLAAMRALTARMGQLLLFMTTVLLSTMLLSNLVEEKSNKVIEVLAAAVPVDAIFIGKLFSMLAVSLVGIGVWTAAAVAGFTFWPMGGDGLPTPAVGWPLFVILVLIYYSMNYLLLGAAFLGIGSQAASIREVQTLSMPVTIGQVLIFFFASMAVGPFDSLIGIAAAMFPFSSPLTMIARAAQTPTLWHHLVAIAWQALWVWLTVKLTAGLFRHNVMKSGGGGTTSPTRRGLGGMLRGS
ncbi:MAG TPA: ABC transporter permease [Allosphingosinicella sp.]|jgi:ABC-2 type transport system permease protein